MANNHLTTSLVKYSLSTRLSLDRSRCACHYHMQMNLRTRSHIEIYEILLNESTKML